jgi:hypothetical protein
MTTKQLSFKALPQLAIAESDTTPNPSIAGVMVWSTTLGKPVYWTGSIWTAGTSGGGGGGSYTSGTGTATLDFGTGSNEASVTVTGLSGILSTAAVTVGIKADATSGTHTANDHKYVALFCAVMADTPIVSTGFTIYARSSHLLQGTFVVEYNWSNQS